MRKKIFVAVSVVLIGLLAMCVAGWIMKSCSEDLEGAQEASRGGKYMFLTESVEHITWLEPNEGQLQLLIDRLEKRINANAGKWRLIQVVTFYGHDDIRNIAIPFSYTAIMERREK